jgi:hypothetical protein
MDFHFRQPSMASYSFSSPGYVNIPPYYNTAPNGYSALNFQYPLPESMFKYIFISSAKLLFYLLKAYSTTGASSASSLTSSSPYGTQSV